MILKKSYMRRDTVKRLTTIKQKENKDDNSLEKKS